jgi:hypothetical protein
MLDGKDWDDVVITTAMLMGAEPTYIGYQRSSGNRTYWEIGGPPYAYGYTRASCAISWLDMKGIGVDPYGNVFKRDYSVR